MSHSEMVSKFDQRCVTKNGSRGQALRSLLYLDFYDSEICIFKPPIN